MINLNTIDDGSVGGGLVYTSPANPAGTDTRDTLDDGIRTISGGGVGMDLPINQNVIQAVKNTDGTITVGHNLFPNTIRTGNATIDNAVNGLFTGGLSGITAAVKSNPLLAVAVVGGLAYFLTKKKGRK